MPAATRWGRSPPTAAATELHAGHAAGQRHGDRRHGHRPDRQYRPAGRHHGGRGGAAGAGDRSEQRHDHQRHRGGRGAKVISPTGNGNPIGETTADGSGNWTFTPATPLANGTVVNAVAQDPAGNTGPQGSTTVDAVAEHACGQSEQRQPAQRYRRAGQHRDLDRRQRQPDRPDHRRWQRQLELHARLATAQRHRGQRDRERRRRQYQRSRYHDGGFLTAVDPAGGSEQRLGDQRHRGRRQHHHHHRWQRQPDWPGHRRRQRQLVLHSGIPLPDGTVVNVVARSQAMSTVRRR